MVPVQMEVVVTVSGMVIHVVPVQMEAVVTVSGMVVPVGSGWLETCSGKLALEVLL